MPHQLQSLKYLLDQYGRSVDANRTNLDVKSMSCIDDHVPAKPGVYWIETTMPLEAMRTAISEVLGRQKKLRKSPPGGNRDYSAG